MTVRNSDNEARANRAQGVWGCIPSPRKKTPRRPEPDGLGSVLKVTRRVNSIVRCTINAERRRTRAEEGSSIVIRLPGGSPRHPFFASLGTLWWVELHHCFVVDLSGGWTGPKHLLVGHSSDFLGEVEPYEVP
jgi:hypothetical protein